MNGAYLHAVMTHTLPADPVAPTGAALDIDRLWPEHAEALRAAHAQLETPSLAARLAQLAGQPLNRVLRFVPSTVSNRVIDAAQQAILKVLSIAITSTEPPSARPPAHHVASALAGVSGGIGGFFGLAALPVELPVTTTLMLRAIAHIARQHGEDLSTLEGRLACLEVFALGAAGPEGRLDLGYYASRMLLHRLTGDAAAVLVERGVASVSGSAVNSLLATITTRFGLVVSERIAAGAVPVIGALGGATINVVFMNHFQRVAEAHFTLRKLERQYGPALVRRAYEGLRPRAVAASA